MVIGNGNGAWADFPYYGSDKFWFVEDNTIKGIGGISGGIDCHDGGRYVARHNYLLNATRMVMALKVGPCAACALIKFTTTYFTFRQVQQE